MQPEYLNHQAQIELLESRGMIVDTPEALLNHNYSHIIYKFSNLYVDEYGNNQQIINYKHNTRLSYIVNLYELNNDVSIILLKYLIKYEHALKGQIANHLSIIDPIWHCQISIHWVDIKKNFLKNFLEFKRKWKKIFFLKINYIKGKFQFDYL